MDKLEMCIRGTGDPEGCALTHRVLEMVQQMDLVECVRGRGAKECFEECLQKCRGEDCGGLCISAVDVAYGMSLALDMARDVQLAALMGVEPLDAAALSFAVRLEKVWEKECPDRAAAARILVAALVELRNLLRIRELLLLLAPLLSAEHGCTGEEVFEFLDSIVMAVGEEMVAKIAAALEEGAVVVGNVVIRFPPVRTEF